jgi:hypothetical protein
MSTPEEQQAWLEHFVQRLGLDEPTGMKWRKWPWTATFSDDDPWDDPLPDDMGPHWGDDCEVDD